MSPRRNSRPQKQPRLRSLQLCPPERRQNQTQTSSLPATAAPYLSHSAVKSRKRARHFTLQHIFCHRCSRGHLIGNAQRFTCPSRSTCLSVRSQQLSLKGSSDRFDRSPSVSCRSHGQQAARITQKDIRKRTKIPPPERDSLRLYSADRSARRACSRELLELREALDGHADNHRKWGGSAFKVKA